MVRGIWEAGWVRGGGVSTDSGYPDQMPHSAGLMVNMVSTFIF